MLSAAEVLTLSGRVRARALLLEGDRNEASLRAHDVLMGMLRGNEGVAQQGAAKCATTERAP